MTSITLTRINYAPTYTLGFIKHGDFFCFTLEPAKKEKHGCIPCGVYPIVWEHSPKFKCKLWELKNVPGRSEIKVHAGNRLKDTKGCILPGFSYYAFPQKNEDFEMDENILIGTSEPALRSFNQLCHDQQITEIEIREV